MPSRTRCGAGLLLGLALLFASVASASAAPPSFAPAKGYYKHVCADVHGPVARCHAEVVTDQAGTPLTAISPVSGYWPEDLQSAYNLASAAATNGGTQTVALVESGDAPTAEADLGVYRHNFGLSDCTTTNGCFRKVDQNGGTAYPATDASWAQETSLDFDMVAAICPNCHILLVEAASASYANLAAAVDTAVRLGATQVSNSYGGSETFGGSYESHYNHPGVDITVSSGDSGYGVQFPASSPHVTAVGGTHLVRNSSSPSGWTETAWSGAGSGCSSTFAKPSWQHDTGCSRRTVADVSAVADPNTGVAVYDSTPYGGSSGWMVFGGTSVAAPIVAAVNALAGGRSAGSTYGSFAYSNPSLFTDVLSGSNGSCSGSYLCTAKAGYDGPTGMGTPYGVTAGPPPNPPSNTGAPTISGTAAVGQTLSSTPGSWDPAATSYQYDWFSCATSCQQVASGPASTYTLKSSDETNTVYVDVTATNAGGSSSPAQSNTLGPVQPAPPPPPDFSIAASPPSQSVVRGGSASYTVTVTPLNGFASNVSLGVSGLPASSSATSSPNPLGPPSWTSTLKVTTAQSTPNGTRTLTITGTSSSLAHSTTVSLTVKKR
jgi:hypothetical protein